MARERRRGQMRVAMLALVTVGLAALAVAAAALASG
jgi:hypothetical protein